MKILALDTSSKTASAAAWDGELRAEFTVQNGLTHSETILPMVQRVIETAGWKPADLTGIAVAVGPGSFTGVRIGVATVKGLAFPKGLPCAPVSTLESLAENLSGTEGIVCALMDARRNQFYYALFENGVRLTPDSCGGMEEICALLGEKKATLCGDGAAVFASLFPDRCPHTVANPVIREQNALSTALCGYRMYMEGKTVSGKELRPTYLRVPQAERERLEKERNQT